MKQLQNNSGIALILSLVVMMFLVTFSGIFLLRIFTQRNIIENEKNLTNAYYLAEAGAQAGLSRLNILINAYLLNSVNSANPDTVAQKTKHFVAVNEGPKFLTEFVKENGVSQLTLSDTGYASHTGVIVLINGGQYQYRIHIRQKGTPIVIAAEIWDFYYYFTVESVGTVGSSSRKIVASGDFTLRVQRDDFSKQVLFNNAEFNTRNSPSLFTATSNDITDKITWQESQPTIQSF